MIKIILIIIAAYTVGRIHSYYKNRKQCVNCGGHRTYHVACGYSGVKGSKCNFAVKNWESFCCKDCDEMMSSQTELIP